MASSIDQALKDFVADRPILDQLTTRRLNGILSYIRGNTLQPGVGTLLNRTVNGVSIDGLGKGKGATEDVEYPFECLPQALLELKIRAGMVTNRIPSNMSETFTASDGELFYLDIDIDPETAAITAVEIAHGSEVPEIEPSANPTKAYLLLFSVTVEDGSITDFTPYVKSSQWGAVAVVAQSCDISIKAMAFEAV